MVPSPKLPTSNLPLNHIAVRIEYVDEPATRTSHIVFLLGILQRVRYEKLTARSLNSEWSVAGRQVRIRERPTQTHFVEVCVEDIDRPIVKVGRIEVVISTVGCNGQSLVDSAVGRRERQ